MNALLTLWCRFFGRSRGPQRPASKDIVKEMRERGQRADEEKAEYRRARTQGISDALYPPLRNGRRPQ